MDALIIASYTSGAIENVLTNISQSVDNGWKQMKSRFKRFRNNDKESKLSNEEKSIEDLPKIDYICNSEVKPSEVKK